MRLKDALAQAEKDGFLVFEGDEDSPAYVAWQRQCASKAVPFVAFEKKRTRATLHFDALEGGYWMLAASAKGPLEHAFALYLDPRRAARATGAISWPASYVQIDDIPVLVLSRFGERFVAILREHLVPYDEGMSDIVAGGAVSRFRRV